MGVKTPSKRFLAAWKQRVFIVKIRQIKGKASAQLGLTASWTNWCIIMAPPTTFTHSSLSSFHIYSHTRAHWPLIDTQHQWHRLPPTVCTEDDTGLLALVHQDHVIFIFFFVLGFYFEFDNKTRPVEFRRAVTNSCTCKQRCIPNSSIILIKL